ncbi:hypothetical protein TNCV_373681 [Trichonephila clavipes]|nr:hypothetical protein TNCV_373681 [Trichonephila clavipes]
MGIHFVPLETHRADGAKVRYICRYSNLHRRCGMEVKMGVLAQMWFMSKLNRGKPRLHGRKMPAKYRDESALYPFTRRPGKIPGRNAGTFFIPSFD